jgi:hypothetical protein
MTGFTIAGNSVDNLSQRGFRLAHFIVHDRPSAIQIVIRAWNKLNARCKQEGKRAYWRDKYLKRWVTKISRTDCDALQWLIYFECEEYEKRQEQWSQSTTENLIIHYIKSLVQIGTARSSFYVVIGMHRLLHDYSTSDIQDVYEMLTERYLGADEYRRTKRFLMNKLTTRFGDLLRTVTVAHGEVRFELFENQQPWAALVQECLRTFIPWSTSGHCLVPAGFGPASMALPSLLSGTGDSTLTPDAVETNRCHAFIDPVCYSRLVRALALDPPEQRLALPRFFLGNAEDRRDSLEPPPAPPDLTPSEREMIHASLAAEAARRKQSVPQTLRILVDGIERDQISFSQSIETDLELEEGAKLVEIWARDKDGDFVLATHLLSYLDSHRIAPSTASLTIGSVRLALVVSSKDESPSVLTLTTHHPGLAIRGNNPVSFSSRAFQHAALALLFIGIGWTLGFVTNRQELLSQRARTENIERKIDKPRASLVVGSANQQRGEASAVVTQELIPDLSTRGGEAAAPPVVSLSAHATLLNLELPLDGHLYRSLRAVLRVLPERNEIMSERLTNVGTGIINTAFFVPIVLLSDDKDYVIEVSGTTSAGTSEYISMFPVHILKKKE